MADSVMAKIVSSPVDVLVLDYSLSNDYKKEVKNGLDLAKKVMEQYSDIRIMMLTMHDIPEVIVPCVEAGIHGYMLKSDSDFDIAIAIRKLVETGQYFSPSVARNLALSMHQFYLNRIELSPRELEVLDQVFQGNTAKEIGSNLFISPQTVESHRKKLLSKFEAKNSIHLLRKALDKGFLKL
jgi:DNA-binding NarL/FixJ family response regulator